jgi:hypothetical protein
LKKHRRVCPPTPAWPPSGPFIHNFRRFLRKIVAALLFQRSLADTILRTDAVVAGV